MRFVRVSDVLAFKIHSKIPLLLDFENFSQCSNAGELCSNAVIKSEGIMASDTSFSASQVPFCLAYSIFAKPAGIINPSVTSLATRVLLRADQLLLSLRGVKSSFELDASMVRFELSIQPKHKASSTDSA